MDAEYLGSDLEVLGSCGVVLSVEQRAQLQSSLVVLRNKCKFRRVGLWGVIHGISANYFIAVGVGRDELGDRKYLYRYTVWRSPSARVSCFLPILSQDCKQWSQLTHADRTLREKCARLQGRFTGRPEHIHEQQMVEKVGEGDNVQERTTTVSDPPKSPERALTRAALCR